jgi:Tol biopolymer transport system component
MSSNRWDEIERLYHDVLSREPGDRAAFLDGACADNEPLRREIESLLDNEPEADGFLLEPAVEVAARLIADAGSGLIGRHVGAYQVLSLLGVGGMGEVYRARDTKLARDVAIKILPPLFTSSPERLARFEREARMLAALNHPHIGAIYGLEDSDGIRALVLELVEGETLADRIQRGPLLLKEALPIAQQIADALEAAHEKGIVHRDLKPANIKITPEGVVKVLDFGLAKAGTGDAAGPDLSKSPTATVGGTREGVTFGTAAYMSPEQARGKPVDKRADIWAFGCVLYEMLTGTRAFRGETTPDTIAAILEHEPDWNRVPAATPASIRRLLVRCLTKDPKQRLRDIGDAPLDLTEPGPSERTAIATKPSPRAWMAVAVLLLALVAALIPAVLYFRSVPPPAREVRLEIPLPAGTGGPSPAISPDGRRVVYVAAAGSGRTALWVRSLNAVDAEMLQGTDEAIWPFWSPDSRWIAFFAGGKLKKVEAAGGPPLALADVAGVVRAGTWNRDGIIVFSNTVLRRIADSGGDVTDLTELDQSLQENFHSWPSFLPDGRHFLYLGWSATPENRAVYIGSLESKTRTRLMGVDSMAIYAAPGFVLFARGGFLMARPFDPDRLEFTGEAVALVEEFYPGGQGRSPFDASDEGTLIYRDGGVATNRRLVWMDRTGKTIGPVSASSGGNTPSLSPDGRRVAFSESSGTDRAVADLWIYDFDRGTKTKLTTDPSINHWPIWSPDASRLVFDSSRGKYGAGHALYEKLANGATPERLLLEPEPGMDGLVALDWSRDGRIVFMAHPVGTANRDLWVLPPSGDRKPFPYLMTPFDEIEASLSPNGRWLAYTSNESGSYQVVVRSFPDPSRDRRQISTQGGGVPRWSGDGREIYYLDPGGRIVAVALTADQNLEIGKSTPLFETPLSSAVLRSDPAWSYDVTSDGQQFLISTPPASNSARLIAVLNWPAGLKRQ